MTYYALCGRVDESLADNSKRIAENGGINEFYIAVDTDRKKLEGMLERLAWLYGAPTWIKEGI